MFHQKHAVLKLAVLAAMSITLPGCQHGIPSSEPSTPAAVVDPYFATNEEALQAGIDGYSAYLTMSDEITASGGVDPQRIAPYVSEKLLPSFVEGYESLLSKGLRSRGSTAFDSTKLQSWTTDGANVAHVSFYLCIDVEGVRLLDDVGNDVTPSDRASRIPVLATIRVAATIDNAVLTENEPWSGESFC